MKASVCCLCFLCFINIHGFTSIDTDNRFISENITKRVFTWFNADKQVTPDSALQQLRNTSKPYGKSYFDVNHLSFYWIYIPIHNRSNSAINLLLEVDNPHIDTLYYWAYKHNNLVDASVTGDCLAFDSRKVEHRNFLFPFALESGDSIELLLKICKFGQPMALQFSLYNQSHFAAIDARLTALHMLIFGALLLLIFFLLSFALYMRQFSLLLLVMAMVSLMLEASWQLGYGFQYLCRHLVWYNNLMRATFLTSFAFFNVLYVYKVLHINTYSRYWAIGLRFLIAVSGLFMLSIIVLGILGINVYSYALKLYFVFMILFVCCLFLLLIILLKCYNQTVKSILGTHLYYFYALAFLIMTMNFILLTFSRNIFPYAIIKHFSLISCAIFIALSCWHVLRVVYEQYQQKLVLQDMANRALIQGQEQERERIAGELHDTISNSLFALRNFLQFSKFSNPSEQERLTHMTTNIAKEVRNLSHRLVPIDYRSTENIADLVADLCVLMQDAMPQTKISFRSDLPDNLLLHQPEARAILYRIVQELLTNIAKHANAETAQIHLYSENGILYLVVSDSGIGFNTNEKPKGLGLRNIRSYVDYLHGKLSISSEPSKTVVSISLPLRFS